MTTDTVGNDDDDGNSICTAETEGTTFELLQWLINLDVKNTGGGNSDEEGKGFVFSHDLHKAVVESDLDHRMTGSYEMECNVLDNDDYWV